MEDRSGPITGGCLCGEVRFAANGRHVSASYCHCDDCRKATGAPVTVFVEFRCADVVFAGRPKSIASSPNVRRSFCDRCGTPIAYEDGRLAGDIYIMLGALDRPEDVVPQHHSFDSLRLPWLELADDLPRYARYSKARGEEDKPQRLGR